MNNINRMERFIFCLPLLQWDFVSVFWFGFVVLTRDTTSSYCTKPVECSSPVVDSFAIVNGFGSSRRSTPFVVES